MIKIEDLFSKLIYIFTIIIFLIIFIFSFKYDSNVYYSQNKFISLLFCIIIMVLWYFIYKILCNKIKSKVSKKTYILTIIIYLIIVSLIQLFILKHFMVKPGWDYNILYENAKYYLQYGNRKDALYKEYFQLFPNNKLLFYILVKAMWLGNFVGLSPLRSCILLNIFIIDFALIILFLTLNKKFDYKTALFGMIITLFFLPIFLYTPIFYSDTFSLFIGISLIYTYLFVDKKNTICKNNIITFIIFGLLLFLGKEIKITSTFVFIAIIINYIISSKKIKIFINIFITIVTFLIITFLFKTFIANNSKYNFEVDSYGSYPYTHWIMMGTEDVDKDNSSRSFYGGYNEEDYFYSKSFKNGKEASKYDLIEYKKRVKKMGIIGYPIYLLKKAVNAWTDGYYFSDVKLSINRVNINDKVYYFMFKNNIGKYIFINFTQGVQYAFIISLINLSYLKLTKKENEINYNVLSILAIFAFLLLWENRSRYLYNYIPLFILIICTYYNSIKNIQSN